MARPALQSRTASRQVRSMMATRPGYRLAEGAAESTRRLAVHASEDPFRDGAMRSVQDHPADVGTVPPVPGDGVPAQAALMQPCRAILARPRFRTGAVEQPVALPIRGKAGRLAARGVLPVARRGPAGLDAGAERAGATLAASMRVSSSLTSSHEPVVDRLSNTMGGRIRAQDDDSVLGDLEDAGDSDGDDNDDARQVDDEDVALGRSQPLQRTRERKIRADRPEGKRGGHGRAKGISRLQLAATAGAAIGAASRGGQQRRSSSPPGGSRRGTGRLADLGSTSASLAARGGKPQRGGLLTLKASLTAGVRAGGSRPAPIHDPDAAAEVRALGGGAGRWGEGSDSDSDENDGAEGMPSQPALYRGSVLDGTAPVGRLLLAVDGVGGTDTASRAAALRIGGSMAGAAARRSLRQSVRAAGRAESKAGGGSGDDDGDSGEEEGPGDDNDEEEEFLVGEARATSAPAHAQRGKQLKRPDAGTAEAARLAGAGAGGPGARLAPVQRMLGFALAGGEGLRGTRIVQRVPGLLDPAGRRLAHEAEVLAVEADIARRRTLAQRNRRRYLLLTRHRQGLPGLCGDPSGTQALAGEAEARGVGDQEADILGGRERIVALRQKERRRAVTAEARRRRIEMATSSIARRGFPLLSHLGQDEDAWKEATVMVEGGRRSVKKPTAAELQRQANEGARVALGASLRARGAFAPDPGATPDLLRGDGNAGGQKHPLAGSRLSPRALASAGAAAGATGRLEAQLEGGIKTMLAKRRAPSGFAPPGDTASRVLGGMDIWKPRAERIRWKVNRDSAGRRFNIVTGERRQGVLEPTIPEPKPSRREHPSISALQGMVER